MFKTKSGRNISYFGNEYTKEIHRKNENNCKIKTIDELFEILLDVWCRETAYPSCQKSMMRKMILHMDSVQ